MQVLTVGCTNFVKILDRAKFLVGALSAPLPMPNKRDSSGYCPSIDGLRAIAIISVVAFHIGLPGFPGGFTGVDVFFVISGFLITTLLVGELRQRGSIDLLAFFARRARRLLPAFFLVVAVTLVLGFFLLVPIDGEQERLANSATAAALYISNLHFAWNGDNYFELEFGLVSAAPHLVAGGRGTVLPSLALNAHECGMGRKPNQVPSHLVHRRTLGCRAYYLTELQLVGGGNRTTNRKNSLFLCFAHVPGSSALVPFLR